MVKRVILLVALLACAAISFVLGLWVPGAILLSVDIVLIILSLPSPPPVYLSACVAVVIPLLLSLAAGVDWANLQKFSSKQQQTVTTDSAEFERILLRSGEKGILVFDRASQQTDFLPWNQIRRVSRKTNFWPWIYR